MKKRIHRTILIIVSCLLLMIVATCVYFFLKQTTNPLKKIFKPYASAISNIDDNSKAILNKELSMLNPTITSINPSPALSTPMEEMQNSISSDNVIDILVLGVDSREMQIDSQTDLIMVIRFDKKKKLIKVISISRDIYLNIPGYAENRINEALIYGGPQLVMSTINQYFGLALKYFVVLNFENAEDIINMIGKIDIVINQNDLKYINPYINELNKLSPDTDASAQLTHTGQQQLDGRQAVAYARYRPETINDIERTGRERTVLFSIMQHVKELSPDILPGLINKSLDTFYTNIPITQYPSFGMDLYTQRDSNMEQIVIPIDGSFKQERIIDMKYLVIDFRKNVDALSNFLNN